MDRDLLGTSHRETTRLAGYIFGGMAPEGRIINDVTGLSPVRVRAMAAPATLEELRDTLVENTGPVSIGAGGFSMGGQTASPGSLHIDMRRLNTILGLCPQQRTIRVQAGVRWRDIQRVIDPHDLAVKIMPSYANFTVGGSLSVNAHGRHVGQGPIINSVRSLTVVLADGEVKQASPADDPDLFYGVIGGYGGLGVIAEAELDLAGNAPLERVTATLPVSGYMAYFRKMREGPREAVLHSAALRPPRFANLLATTWLTTLRPAPRRRRLRPDKHAHRTPRAMFHSFRARVHWRNYEAGCEIAEPEPPTERKTTEVLQEYFAPVDRFEEFVAAMGEILRRYRVDVIDVSVRHATADPGSPLAWARQEVCACLLHYRQEMSGRAKETVAVWTRELIEGALRCGGSYSLAYQVHATPDQFHRAYPQARQFFALKRWLDPQFRLRNALWDAYYTRFLDVGVTRTNPSPGSEFHAVFSDAESRDGFYRHLQSDFKRCPEDRLQEVISSACVLHAADEAIYRRVAQNIPSIAPPLAALRRAFPALAKQKRAMVRQTLELLAGRSPIRGYVEIGSRGRIIGLLRRGTRVEAPIILVNDVAPSRSLSDIVERGRLRKLGRFLPLSDYAPIVAYDVPDSSVDVVASYIGLHRAPLDRLDGFVRSLWRILRPGGFLILRDHDVTTPAMKTLVSLTHAVSNAGAGISWEQNREERRHFTSVEERSRYLAARGFRDAGKRLLEANDPTDNTLMLFVRTDTMSQRAIITTSATGRHGKS